MYLRSVAALALLSFMSGENLYAKATDIKDVAAYRDIIKKQGPKVIVFSSTTCTACDSHMQALDEAAKKHPKVAFYSFDVGDLPDLRKELEIKYYPTTHFLPLGKKIDRSMGAAEIEEILYELVNGKKKSEAPAPQPAMATPAKNSCRK